MTMVMRRRLLQAALVCAALAWYGADVTALGAAPGGTPAGAAARRAARARAAGQVRAAAPDIRIVTLPELDETLAAHKGSGVLLNFWAIWCEPCVAEMPELVEVAREFRGRGGVVLTVSYDLMVPDVTGEGVLAEMRRFVAERGIDLPVLIFDGPDYDAINARFGLPGPVPATVAIDPRGAIVARHDGKAGRQLFAALMRKALGR